MKELESLFLEAASNKEAATFCIQDPSSDFFTEGALDSLGIIQIVLALEKLLDREISIEHIEAVRSFNDLKKLFHSLRN